MLAILLNHIPHVPDWVQSIVMPLNRWLHIIATATLIGGALFYEFVIPKAIEELKDETQLAVLGRVRWVFRRLVIFSTIVICISGLVETWHTWPSYHGPNYDAARPWWAVHVGVGVIAMAIMIRVTLGDRVPRHPIAWLRVAFVVMLVAAFLASLTRHVRLTIEEDIQRYGGWQGLFENGPTRSYTNPEEATTEPTTEPTSTTATTQPIPVP
jgi:uncharacterized membrane protein